MSSLRLALKQSLEENPQLHSRSSSRRHRKKNKNKDLEQHLDQHGTITLRHDAPGSSGLSSSSSSDGTSSDDSSSSSSDDDDSDSTSSSSSDSSSSDSSSSDDDEADREAKELFDADLSSDNDDDTNKKKKNANDAAAANDNSKSKHHHSAANTIQNHWKKKANPNTDFPPKNNANAQQQQQQLYRRVSDSGSVRPPTPLLLSHVRSLYAPVQRRAVSVGHRVKVRFVKKGTSDVIGRITRKLKWYGGVVAERSSSGKRIRIQYDDGTEEVADFPDKDIVVDCEGNGRHSVVGGGGTEDVFVPHEEEEDGSDGAGEEGGSAAEGGDGCDRLETKKKHKKDKRRHKNDAAVAVNADSDTHDVGSDHSVQREKKSKSSFVGDNAGSSELLSEKERQLAHDELEDEPHPLKETGEVVATSQSQQTMDEVPEPTKKEEIFTQHKAGEINKNKQTVPLERKPSKESNPINSNAQQQQQQYTSPIPRKSPLLVKSPITKTVVLPPPPFENADNNEKPTLFSSNSGSTCSNTSFVGGGDNNVDDDTKEEKPILKDASDVVAEDSSGLKPMDTEEAAADSQSAKEATAIQPNKDAIDDQPKKEAVAIDSQPTKEAAVDGPSKLTPSDVEETINSHPKKPITDEPTKKTIANPATPANTPVKKHRPLAIKIALPKRKRPEDEGKSTPRPGVESNLAEPVKKKMREDDHVETKTQTKPGLSLGVQTKSDVPLGMKSNDESDLVAEHEVKSPLKVDVSSDPPRKKPKLSIHISKKKIKAAEEAVAENSKPLPSKPAEEAAVEKSMPPLSTVPTTVSTTVQPPSEIDASQPREDERKAQVEKEIAANQEKINTDNSELVESETKPSNVAPTSPEIVEKPADTTITEKVVANNEPVHEEKADPVEPIQEKDSTTIDKVDNPMKECEVHQPSPRTNDDDKQAYSLERSGRKAAKEAAEKLKVKKNKKKEKSGKTATEIAEEDPWVQCDRCLKWRHLPPSVDVNALPEHWFCELNTYDELRNNCQAPEQKPKDVAKEKKRLKKLELKKMQMEQAVEGGPDGNKTSTVKDDADGGMYKRKRSSSPDPNDCANKNEDDNAGGESPKPKPKKRGRPRNEDKLKAKEEKQGKDDKKQEWVQCEKCEKWRRLPPRIKAEDLPDVWFCSMNTWDINLATCTAIEDKLEPKTRETFNVQSQIPLSSGSSGKLSYRNLIFGNGRRKKKVSERMRAQESLFSLHNEGGSEMSAPPTVMYASSDAFSSTKALQEPAANEGDRKNSIFDILMHSRAWTELNDSMAVLDSQKEAAYNSVGYSRYCNNDGSLKDETIDTLKTMVYFTLTNKVLLAHELLLEIQCCHWKYVPRIWFELRAICTIEIVDYILNQMMKEGLVESLQDCSSNTQEFYYRITPDPDPQELSTEEISDKTPASLKVG